MAPTTLNRKCFSGAAGKTDRVAASTLKYEGKRQTGGEAVASYKWRLGYIPVKEDFRGFQYQRCNK